MITLFKYIDYRKYLKDYYAEKKANTRYFSFRYFADKAGINSPGFIKDVLEGKRNLTNRAAERFSTALGLSKKESVFFRHLVMFNQAKSAEVKQEHYRVIVSMMNLVSEFKIDADRYSYFDKWYTCVVRELICMYDFKEDWSLLAKTLRPKINAKDARDAVSLLLRLKMIRKQRNGAYTQTHSALSSGTESDNMILQARRSFNRAMVEHALSAIDNLPIDKRNISGITMGLSKTGYDTMLAELSAFKERIITIANQDRDISGVYQFNFQVFPLSEDITRIDEIKRRRKK